MVKIREAIGPDIKLMCDINQRWRPGAGDRYRPPRRGCRGRPVLARGCDHRRRLSRPRAHLRRAVDPGRRRRVCLGHRAVPPHDGGALGRRADGRSGAGRRHHPVAQGRRHGRGVQPAGGQPSDPRGACPPDRRRSPTGSPSSTCRGSARCSRKCRRSRTASWRCRKSPASGSNSTRRRWTGTRPNAGLTLVRPSRRRFASPQDDGG